MNALDELLCELLGRAIFQRFAWSLLHFLWQGVIVAALLAVAMRLMRRGSTNVRYALACGALGLLAALPAVTACMIPVPADTELAATEPALPVTDTAEPGMLDGAPVPLQLPVAAVVQAGEMTAEPAAPLAWYRRLPDVFMPALPYVVGAWAIGVLLLSSWRTAGWVRVRQIKTRSTQPVGAHLAETFAELARRLGVCRPVRLMRSGLVKVPAVIGWLRPVLLLPAGALSGLPPQQLRAILAHELAHVRRYDYLVNLIQTVIETLLFYHPAVWWISSRIRVERENCCDDDASAVSGGQLLYARALVTMEELRQTRMPLAGAATGGGSLINRIRRLLGSSADQSNRSTRWLAGAIAATILAVLTIAIGMQLSCAAGESARGKTGTKTTADGPSTQPGRDNLVNAKLHIPKHTWQAQRVSNIQRESISDCIGNLGNFDDRS